MLTLFFPALAAMALGVDVAAVNSLPAGWVVAGFVANSFCWALVACPACGGVRRLLRQL
jgi:hypothetical protein